MTEHKVTPEDILAYLDGNDLPHVAAYLQGSPEAVALAADYRALQDGLARVLYRHACPTAQLLGDYALHLTAMADQVTIAAHVNSCPLCAAELAQIRAFLVVEADPPPLGPGERARRLLMAVLAPSPAIDSAALRSAAGTATRTYHAEDITIAIDLLAGLNRARVDLSGSIWRERDDASAVAGAWVELIAPEGAAQSTTVDEFGTFLFEGVAHGNYRLEVTIGTDLIAIAHLRVE